MRGVVVSVGPTGLVLKHGPVESDVIHTSQYICIFVESQYLQDLLRSDRFYVCLRHFKKVKIITQILFV